MCGVLIPCLITYWRLLARKGTDGTGTGDVVGPAGAVDNFPVAFDATTGKLIKAITGAIAALHGVTPAADRLPYFNGASSAALATFTALARSLLDDATGADMFATMGGTLNYANPGRFKLPNNLLVQFGSSVVTTVGEIVSIPFSAAFSTTPLLVIPVNGDTNQPSYASAFGVHSTTSTSFVVRTANISSTSRVNWIAIGLAP